MAVAAMVPGAKDHPGCSSATSQSQAVYGLWYRYPRGEREMQGLVLTLLGCVEGFAKAGKVTRARCFVDFHTKGVQTQNPCLKLTSDPSRPSDSRGAGGVICWGPCTPLVVEVPACPCERSLQQRRCKRPRSSSARSSLSGHALSLNTAQGEPVPSDRSKTSCNTNCWQPEHRAQHRRARGDHSSICTS